MDRRGYFILDSGMGWQCLPYSMTRAKVAKLDPRFLRKWIIGTTIYLLLVTLLYLAY